ncbi:hypothetical protein EJB05_31896, partial [Eragrostis curvula]
MTIISAQTGYCISGAIMANSGAFLLSASWRSLTIFSLVAVLTKTTAAVDQEKLDCPFFSCGHLQDIRYPFRMQGDPPGCGVQAYELVCSDNKAIIYINTGRYFVTNISYTEPIFWVVDANLDNSSCPIPETNQHPYTDGLQSEDTIQLYPDATTWAAFVNCSQPVGIGSNVVSNPDTFLSVTYKPVGCRSKKNSFVYVWTSSYAFYVGNMDPSCRYLSMIPLGSSLVMAPDNANYEDVVKFMRNGFAVKFPFPREVVTYSWIINRCLNDSVSYFYTQISSSSILNQISAVIGIDLHFLRCVNDFSYRTKLFWAAVTIVSAVDTVKFMIGMRIFFSGSL